MTAFHDVRFPASIAFGAVGGPERLTQIVTLSSGKEERNSPWSRSRRRWDVGAGVKSLDDMAALIAFFEARMGALYGFRFTDPFDASSTIPVASITAGDQNLGSGDGTTTNVQLIKTYESGGHTTTRTITKPHASSVLVALDGTAQTQGVDYTIDSLTGVVSFASAPTAGASITAGFTFDTPVRFDTDRLDISLEAFGAGEAPSISLIEIID